jgi:hypothetical protein
MLHRAAQLVLGVAALGHLFDLSCRWTAGAEGSSVDPIIFGRLGLLERVGFREHKPASLPWSAVKEVKEHVIVVADAAAPQKAR